MHAVILPLKQNIIKPCAQNAADGAEQQNVQHFVQIQFPFVRHSAAEQYGKQKTERDNHAVKLDAEFLAEQRKFAEGGIHIKNVVDSREVNRRVIGKKLHRLTLL